MIGGFEIMAHKLKLRDLGMDTMEILYYERQAARKKAYSSKQRKITRKKVKSAKKLLMDKNSDTFSNYLKKAI